MNVSVMLEQVGESGYRATVLVPAPLITEAATREEALRRIREMIRERLSDVEMVQLEVPEPMGSPDPWMTMAGTWRGRPDLAELEQNFRDYRNEVDADPGRL